MIFILLVTMLCAARPGALQLSGGPIVVTGASRGLGRGIAEHLMAHTDSKLVLAVRDPTKVMWPRTLPHNSNRVFVEKLDV